MLAKMEKNNTKEKIQRLQSLSVSDGLEEGEDLILVKGKDVSLQTEKDFYTSYEPLEELGRGKFGIVRSCRDVITNEIYAAKFIASSDESKRETLDEIRMMNKLHHKRLIRLQDGFETPSDLIIVMELVTGGELFEKVVEEDHLTEKQVVRYLRQIFFGIQHMHEKMIAHLDLKPENILCVKGNRSGYEEIKLIDFGMAKELIPGADVRVACGTPEFVAPEVISFQPIGLSSDMWSVGVIAYVLLSGLSPFAGDDDVETLQYVAHCQWDFDDGFGIFEQISEDAKHFIGSLLVRDPTERPTIQDCFEHAWCKSFEKASETKLDTKYLRKYVARRRWHKTRNALKALQCFGSHFRTQQNKLSSNKDLMQAMIVDPTPQLEGTSIDNDVLQSTSATKPEQLETTELQPNPLSEVEKQSNLTQAKDEEPPSTATEEPATHQSKDDISTDDASREMTATDARQETREQASCVKTAPFMVGNEEEQVIHNKEPSEITAADNTNNENLDEVDFDSLGISEEL